MIKFANINFDLLTKDKILCPHQKILFVVTANAEIIVKANEESRYNNLLKSASCTFDGQIPFWLARFKNRSIKIEKISGSDLIYDVCQMALNNNQKIFLLGGPAESNSLAQKNLKKRYPQILISGFSPEFSLYPFKSSLNQVIEGHLSDFRPDYVFVGFGAGKQEEWIYDNLDFLQKLGTQIVVGSGGTFEFVSGKIKRAPVLIQKIGLEGIFRLLVEPKWFRVKRILKSFKIFYYAFKVIN